MDKDSEINNTGPLMKTLKNFLYTFPLAVIYQNLSYRLNLQDILLG